MQELIFNCSAFMYLDMCVWSGLVSFSFHMYMFFGRLPMTNLFLVYVVFSSNL